MDHKEDRARADGPERIPPFFLAIMETVELCQSDGIVENLNRPVETDIMLDHVLAILRFVPFEVHRGD